MNELFHKVFRINRGFVQSAERCVYIPTSFEMPVLRHLIINNVLEKSSNFSPPLLLGIQGNYGMGKTFMVKEICRKYGIELIQISSSEFSGSVEAASRDKFKRTYEDACIRKAKSKQYTAILIDDFHLSIATEDDVGKTVNSSLLTSTIMNICDNPWISNYRIPIILTGNNFSRVYGALIRVGRLDLLTWTPDENEKYEIVKNIFFSKFDGLDTSIIRELLNTFPNNSIAFFSQVAEDILLCSCESALDCFISSKGSVDILELQRILKCSLENVSNTPSDILRIAEIRNKQTIMDFEAKTSNPNQIVKDDTYNE